MTADLHQRVRILFTCTRSCWDWYTAEVTRVKTPEHGLKRSIELSGVGWMQQQHIQLMIQNSLCDQANLRFMQISQGDVIADDAVMLVWHLVRRRCWSSSKHDCPPECYAGIASAAPERMQSGIVAMKSDWEHLMVLEQECHNDNKAMKLWEDITFALSPAIRLLFLLFERDAWRVQSLAGRKYLRCFLCKLPDNKLVEDIHHSIRTESRGNPNKKMMFSTMQYLVLNSRALESRGIAHLPALTLEVFEREFKAARTGVVLHSKHKPARHKLKKSWTKLMGRRTWKSPTPEGIHVAVAAWRWLQNYMAGYGMGLPGRCIDSASFSKLVMPHVLVLRDDDPDRVLASLGNAKWAALGWPVVRAGELEGRHLYKFAPNSQVSVNHGVPCSGGTLVVFSVAYAYVCAYMYVQIYAHMVVYARAQADARVQVLLPVRVRCGLLKVEWFHVIDPLQWSVITVEGCRVQEGIVLLQTQPAISLLKHCLSVKNDLMHADLVKCARRLELDCAASASRIELLRALAQAVGGAEFADLCANIDTTSLDEDPLLQDPLVELAYDELEEDDQVEFRDLKQAFKDRKVRDRVNSWRAARNLPHIARAKKRARMPFLVQRAPENDNVAWGAPMQRPSRSLCWTTRESPSLGPSRFLCQQVMWPA